MFQPEITIRKAEDLDSVPIIIQGWEKRSPSLVRVFSPVILIPQVLIIPKYDKM